MDLGASTRQRLSAEELNQCIKNNLYRYYGKSGHFIKNYSKNAFSLIRRLNLSQSQNRSYRLGSS
jgi:thermostable 8-oxoguanine DNA glycosylase